VYGFSEQRPPSDAEEGACGLKMSYIENFFTQLTRMQWSDYLDIIVVAYLIYRFLPMIRSSGAMRVAKTIGLLLVLTWLTDAWNLHTLNFLLNQVMAVGLIAVVVLFQPELRRMLDHIGSVKLKSFLGVEKPVQEMVPIISQTVMACEVMSRERVGALIVFARDNPLDEYIKTGTPVDAQVSEQLMRNIFFPKAALHDGAMIIRDGRIAAAGCVLPLSDSHRLSADLGTRHRAGVGMSEASDAVVVIVSEETGTISVAVGGMLKRHLAPQTLERLLRSELCKQAVEDQDNLVLKLRQKLQKKEKGGSGNEK
jgi:diadenylate cyclase